jgi:hypothetical protein
MLNRTKKKLYEMTDTLSEAVEYLATADADAASAVQSTSLEFVDAMDAAISEAGLPVPIAGASAEAYRAVIDAAPTEYKAVFLPYYDNTWDTMKSVYLAFSQDPMFVTEIVIIPIQRNTNQGTKFVWQDYLTPAGIPNTHYDAYDFAADEPDFVFYNQPYDGVNVPKFQSQNIKKYAGCMIYIPYAMAPIGVQSSELQRNATELPGIQRCDLYIAQSELFKEFYGTGKTIYDRMLPVGNPKCDVLRDARENDEFQRYPEWEESIGGRKVILLNTHYSTMLPGAAAHAGVKFLLDYVVKHEDLFLIWRPHPQVFLMAMSPMYQVLTDFADKHERMILDKTPSITAAYMYSDAVVSLFPSSIVSDALFLDRPVYLMEPDPRKREKVSNHIWFYDAISHEDAGEDGVLPPLRAFLEEIESGIDSKKEIRGKYRAQEFPNMDGTVAEKILEWVKEACNQQKKVGGE